MNGAQRIAKVAIDDACRKAYEEMRVMTERLGRPAPDEREFWLAYRLGFLDGANADDELRALLVEDAGT